jgi:hypothetical protein
MCPHGLGWMNAQVGNARGEDVEGMRQMERAAATNQPGRDGWGKENRAAAWGVAPRTRSVFQRIGKW